MKRALSPQDVLDLQFIDQADLSSDGRAVAYTVRGVEDSDEHFQLLLHDLKTDRYESVARSGAIICPRWRPDGGALAYLGVSLDGPVLSILNVDGIKIKSRRDFPFAGESGVELAWSADGSKIAFVVTSLCDATNPAARRISNRNYRAEGWGYVAGRTQDIFIFNDDEDSLEQIKCGSSFYSNIVWSADDCSLFTLRARTPIPFAGESPSLCEIDVGRGVVKDHLGPDWFINTFRLIPGRSAVALIGAYKSDLPVPVTDLWVVDLEGDDPPSLRSSHSDLAGRVGYRMHHDMPIWSLTSGSGLVVLSEDEALVTVQYGGVAEIVKVGLRGPESYKSLISGERSSLAIGMDCTNQTLLYISTDMLTPPELLVSKNGAEKQITELNTRVMRQWPRLNKMRLEVNGRDGLKLDAWFLSRSADRQAQPTVLFIHGGPYNAIGEVFRFDLHLLASNGIGVVFGNFRGSFGYGEDFARAIVGDWGGKGFGDHIAVVDEAVSNGLADGARLGVWGASHGGFATCWIVGQTDRFSAAIAEASVSNFVTTYFLTDAHETFEREFGGKPHEFWDAYLEHSPIRHAHRCTTPVLLIHGEKDIRCPITEAEQFFAALCDAGCETEMLRLRDANHLGDSIGPPETRVAQNEALLEWFTRFL